MSGSLPRGGAAAAATRLRAVSFAAPLALALAAAGGAGAAQAGLSSAYCDTESRLSVAEKDRLLRVAGVVRAELQRSNADVAIVSRSGLDLARWDIRHSHAGIALRQGADTPWAVRQLYYACDEGQPRIFDQGLAAFILGSDQPDRGHVSMVLVPRPAALLARAAQDNALAISMLAGRYSANAYAFSTRYQNCNQWLAELLAAAWAGITPGPEARAQAQRWLATQGYEPTRVDVGWPLVQWLGAAFSPWLHNDDHPAEDLAAAQYRISLPAALERLVRAHETGAERVQICYAGAYLLVRHGWDTGAQHEACGPEAADERIALD
ncbi:MAG: DUF2145 domain-containing protein [Rubrivivax sp.]|nr:DUF2145 domain-containing protein [Rubrivivax sp.]